MNGFRRSCCALCSCALLADGAGAQPCQPTWSSANEGLVTSFADVRGFGIFDAGDGVSLYACGLNLPGSRVFYRWNGLAWAPVTEAHNYATCLLGIDAGPARGLYAGGFSITGPGITTPTSLVRWDGKSLHAMGGPPQEQVACMIVFDDGTGPSLFVGGSFPGMGGVAANGIAKWNGATWSAVGSGLGSGSVSVGTLAVFDDGTGLALYAAGGFFPPTSPSSPRIAKWDGHQWSGVGGGLNQGVQVLSTFTDPTGTALYAGGSFTAAGGVPCSRIARWNGSQWSALGSGTSGTVYSLATFDDGSGSALFVGGNFASAGGTAAANIAKWNGSWSDVSGGVSGFFQAVYAMHPFADAGGRSLFVGGGFTSAGGQPIQAVARWNGCPVCYANCDGSVGTTGPTLSAEDFLCFLDRFALSDPYTNCDGSTSPPRMNANDFMCFLNAFAAGCS